MPARKDILNAIERFKQLTDSNVEMLVTMHAGLTEIARCEVSPDGGAAMRYIAEKSLARVQAIAGVREVENA